MSFQAGLAEAVRSGLDQLVQPAVDNAPSTAQAAVGNVVQRRPVVRLKARFRPRSRPRGLKFFLSASEWLQRRHDARSKQVWWDEGGRVSNPWADGMAHPRIQQC